MRGKKHSAETKHKMSASRRIRWINNGKQDMAVPLLEVKSYLDNGWVLGRITILDRKWVNDGEGNNRCVNHEDAIRLTYMGWYLGRS